MKTENLDLAVFVIDGLYGLVKGGESRGELIAERK